jgi:hypothetical protein
VSTSVTACGMTDGQTIPCSSNQTGIAIRAVVGGTTGACGSPCFTFTFLNQTVTAGGASEFGFTNLGPGTYQITGQVNGTVGFTLTSLSNGLEGAVPGTVISLSGPNPVATSSSCGINYQIFSSADLPGNFTMPGTSRCSSRSSARPPPDQASADSVVAIAAAVVCG